MFIILSIDSKHNRNYQRIDSVIVNAYKNILENHGTQNVSITLLCRNAGVNRTTFYKHYKGVYEIAQQIEDELLYHLFNVDKISMDDFFENPKTAKNKKLVLKVKINITDFVGAVANLYIQWMNKYFNFDITDISNHIARVIKHVYKSANISNYRSACSNS